MEYSLRTLHGNLSKLLVIFIEISSIISKSLLFLNCKLLYKNQLVVSILGLIYELLVVHSDWCLVKQTNFR